MLLFFSLDFEDVPLITAGWGIRAALCGVRKAAETRDGKEEKGNPDSLLTLSVSSLFETGEMTTTNESEATFTAKVQTDADGSTFFVK
jgi:hypothetical protein